MRREYAFETIDEKMCVCVCDSMSVYLFSKSPQQEHGLLLFVRSKVVQSGPDADPASTSTGMGVDRSFRTEI